MIKCSNCKREQTINECETHKSQKEQCYYCHLQKEHVSEYKDEPDKSPTSTDKMKDKVNKAIGKNKKSKTKDVIVDKMEELKDNLDKDDDGGIYR